MKNTIIILLVVIIAGVGGYMYYSKSSSTSPTPVVATATENENTQPASQGTVPAKAPVKEPAQVDTTKTVIGTSVDKNAITAYHFGTGSDEILLVGGIHGGYEWNTALVAFQMMDYLKANPNIIPKNIKVTVIPVLNPDGLKKVVGTAEKFAPSDVATSQAVVVSGRFNTNTVDINRNFDCDWKSQGVWQTKKVSGGSAAFSEPESQAIKNYVEKNKPTAVVAWYSAGGGVYASNCHDGVLPETTTITKTFATASGYPAHSSFDFYATTGDMVNWFAKNNIPAISVLLTNHTDTELEKNKKGVEALLKHYTK